MIKAFAKKIVPSYSYLYFVVVNLKTAWDNISKLGLFRQDFNKFKLTRGNGKERFVTEWKERVPYLSDNTAETPVDYHYIYHPAWAARIVAKINPVFHVDISSKLDFSTIVSAFIPVKFYDYRPANLSLKNLDSAKGDLMSLPFEDNSLFSVSCMHTVEHIGLGRYGDLIDYDGDLKAIKELIRVTQSGGNIIFVTPVGQPKIIFNAHRIYSYQQILEYFSACNLEEFSLITDNGEFITDANPEMVATQQYGCGCFWLKKK
ncbi:MAG: hypothetical protein JWR61_5486 [Ferruginibacter sp.]|uniref:DUF268 domain-containing protein n=1 Tax=Ferruginibacter sp. TaxID=1940288 RepID=UPI0026593983|nr:DUF268 domain-containing protein [Ferruginibacter sp.]MDB5280531.1 hypothetical protein [Ferruginibacter sp.]